MKILTSYFYKVRFLRPYHIAFSTAVWDPQWFHDFCGQQHQFVDKRGVLNGLRVPPLAPKCEDCMRCKKNTDLARKGECSFLIAYRKQLESLDFPKIITRMNQIAAQVQADLGFTESPQLLLLVHEAPSNPCSERVILQQWLSSHGIETGEFEN